MKKPIQVWQFDDAPEHLKIGSWDDADWLAVVPEDKERQSMKSVTDFLEIPEVRIFKKWQNRKKSWKKL